MLVTGQSNDPAPTHMLRDAALRDSAGQRKLLFKKARRHSFIVRLLKKLIPIGSVTAMAGAVAVLVGARFAEVPLLIDPAKAGIENGRITMQDPHLLGFQKDNRSYQVTADKARQHVKTPNLVELSSPDARVETQVNNFAHIQSAAGLFDTVVESLKLDRDINIVTDDGYRMKLKNADIDMKRGNLKSNSDVSVDMANGNIQAKAIDLTNNGAVINFSGGVTSEFTNLFGMTPVSRSPDSKSPVTAEPAQ